MLSNHIKKSSCAYQVVWNPDGDAAGFELEIFHTSEQQRGRWQGVPAALQKYPTKVDCIMLEHLQQKKHIVLPHSDDKIMSIRRLRVDLVGSI